MFTPYTYRTEGNSVNMENAVSDKRSYHHGDLRAAAIEAGLKLLEDREADDLGLREVARAVGVSATALYRHFPDKAALLAALAGAGLERLGEAQKAASEAAGGGKKGFDATGRAYVRFALANPALFRLIFANVPQPNGSDWSQSNDSAMRLLQENAAQLAAGATDGDRAKVIALRAWSVVHGLTVLMLDGLVAADDAMIDAVIGSHEH